jgi:RNA polymerase sigma factor (sigma-70 family)
MTTIHNSDSERDERFETMFRTHYPRVYRFLRGYRLSREEANDLAQEAFTRFYGKIDQYRGEAEWGFLQTITRNLLINWWRDRSAAKRSGKTVEIDDADVRLALTAREEPDYVEREQEALRSKRLHAAITELPEGQRQCIRLQLAGLKYDEIAKTLRISIDAVKSRRRDALKSLKARLRKEPGGIEWPDAIPEEES